MLPHDLPPWETVYSQFRAWKRQGAWEAVQCTLREFVRIGMGREPHPSALIIDNQSVKTTGKGGLAGTMRKRCVWLPYGVEPPVLQMGFQVLPRRWGVERTFAWSGRYRRFSEDHEQLCETHLELASKAPNAGYAREMLKGW